MTGSPQTWQPWRLRQTGPWRDADLISVFLTALIGVVMIVAAWFGAAGAASLTQQAAWATLAVGGLVVSGIGLSLWLLRLRRAIGQRRVGLISLDPPAAAEPAPQPMPRHDTASLPLVRAEGMRKVHDPGCPLVAGKDVTPAAFGDGEPCAVCQP
ncbi:hypothetical protein [Haloechinothrix halophila]|uniref:hypothetical protein n=1 Tax=Haloechinothrix halophila TaxID=1069073 RepID=UPI0003F76637|nr:hypothetical protein [Haloechinothrix halophila]